MNYGKQLKTLIKKKAIILPGVYDALSAHLAKKVGYKALYLSGGALSVSILGRPDIGLLTLDEVLGVAKRIVTAIQLPLIVDVDTGFGGELNLKRCVQEMELAGVAGIQLEDQQFPKRCGHLKGKSLVSQGEMVKKIQVIKQTRKSHDFLIVARTDARGVSGLKDAVKRAIAYKKAGADILFPEALRSRLEFQAFSSEKNIGTLMGNMTEFGISPALTAPELTRLGYRLALFPMTAFRAAAFSMEKAFTRLKKDGQSSSFLNELQSRHELYKLIKYKG